MRVGGGARRDLGPSHRARSGPAGQATAGRQADLASEPFERLDADERGILGSGLGLSLVASLMMAMHGQIEVASTPQRGSCFPLTLPAADALAESAAEHARLSATPGQEATTAQSAVPHSRAAAAPASG